MGSNPAQLSFAEQSAVDAICMRFEAAWSTESASRLGDCLDESPMALRPALFRELLQLDLELRGRHGLATDAAFYRDRYPDFRDLIEEYLPAMGIALPQTGRGVAGNRLPDLTSGADLAFLAPSERPGSLGRLDQYEILEVLGRGGFGIVLRAFDEALQREVAVKVLAPYLAATSPARKRFLREARASAGIRHENVVQVYAIGEQPLPYLVMEFIAGETLQQRLDAHGPIPVNEAARLGAQIARGLEAAHLAGQIHRDIKPANVLLEKGSGGKAKLTDFGLARSADDASLTQSGVVAGTPLFMAPEQARGEKIDQRADLFSLGSVLYTMLSGRPPFRAETTLAVLKRVIEDTPRPIPEIIPEVPPWLCAVIRTLHAKRPHARFHSAGEVAELLEHYLAGGVPRAPWTASARRTVIVMTCLLFCVALAGVGWFAFLSYSKNLKRELAHRPDLPAGPIVAPAEPPDKIPVAPAEPPAKTPIAPNRKRTVPHELPGTTKVPPFKLPVVPDIKLPAPDELAARPSPLDALKRADIPVDLLAKAGDGDPMKAPPELVAVLAGPNRHTSKVLALAVSPDGKLLASTDEHCGLKLWDLTTGQFIDDIADVPAGHRTDKPLAISFAPDGKTLAAVGPLLSELSLWEIPTLRLMHHIKGDVDVFGLAFDSEGKNLAAVGNDVIVGVMPMDTKTWGSSRQGHSASCAAISISPDGKTLATGSINVGGEVTGVLLINVADLRWLSMSHMYKSDEVSVLGLAFSPDNKSIAVTRNPGRVFLMDVARGTRDRILKESLDEEQDAWPKCPTWRADGRLLAWIEPPDNAVFLCDVSREPAPISAIRSLAGKDPDQVASFTMTPQGRHLITGHADGSIHVLRLARQGEVFRVGGE